MSIQDLVQQSHRLTLEIPTKFNRFLLEKINWDNRLIEINGARGVGKTILMLQYFNGTMVSPPDTVYVSLDNFFFAKNSIIDLASEISKEGYSLLMIDEVHKYPPKHIDFDWSREIKNIYDGYPDLKVIYSGSSILNLNRGGGDLSRRAIKYTLPGLSFREFLDYQGILKHPPLSIEEILENHDEITREIHPKTKILRDFKNYLQYGYYPFYKDISKIDENDNVNLYYDRLNDIIKLILETDLPSTVTIDFAGIQKLKRLLMVLATSSPYTPNLKKLENELGINHRTLIKYLEYLSNAKIFNSLQKKDRGGVILRKPDKLFLENPNLIYALIPSQTDIGTVRETFFMNQVSQRYHVTTPSKGDFRVKDIFNFEIGGRNKNTDQIKGEPNSYVVIDDEFGFGNKIPLWLFGFLY